MLSPTIQFRASFQVTADAVKRAENEEYAERVQNKAAEIIDKKPLAGYDSVDIDFTTTKKLKIVGPLKLGGIWVIPTAYVDEHRSNLEDLALRKAEDVGIKEENIPDFIGRDFVVGVAKGKVIKQIATKFPLFRFINIADRLTKAHHDLCAVVTYTTQEGEQRQEVFEKSRWHRSPEKWAEKAMEKAAEIAKENNAQ